MISVNDALGPVLQVARVNGLDTLGFHGNTAMFNTLYGYSTPRTQEVFFVAAVTNTPTTRCLFSSWDVSGINALFNTMPGAKLQMRGGSVTSTVSDQVTNRYAVFDMVYRGSHSTIFTNGVLGLDVNQILTNMSGIALAAFFVSTNGVYSFASMFTFTNELTAAQRSNANWYCTNRFL